MKGSPVRIRASALGLRGVFRIGVNAGVNTPTLFLSGYPQTEIGVLIGCVCEMGMPEAAQAI